MPVYKAEAIILRRRILGEADRVVTFFTREHGKISAAARAVRRTTSRLAGRLEPFAHVRLLLAKGRTLDVVAQVEVVEGLAPLRADLHRFGQAALMAELLDTAVPEGEAHPELFDLLLAGVRRAASADPEAAALWFTVHLISLIGFQPALERCAVCGGPLGAFPSWSHPLGGAVCRRDAGRDPAAIRLPPHLLEGLARLQGAAPEAEIVPAAARGHLLDLLRGYVEHRLEVHLRSPAVIDHLR